MSGLFWWTGALTWAVIAGLLLWIVGFELLIVGGANAVSYHLWMFKSPSLKFRWREHWWELIRSFVRSMFEHWGYRNIGNKTTYYQGGSGYWRGIGDWERPAKECLDPLAGDGG